MRSEDGPTRVGGSGSSKGGKQEQAKSDKERRVDAASKSKKRDDALRAIMTRLEIGEGSTVADIGAGEGRDSWVFAEAVGTDGKVYAEEIAKDKVETLKKQAAEIVIYRVSFISSAIA